MARVWLDDIREASKGFLSCKSVNEAKALIQWFEEREEEIELISCDYDLKNFAYDEGGMESDSRTGLSKEKHSIRSSCIR